MSTSALAPGHVVSTGYTRSLLKGTLYWATCSCGWKAASGSSVLRKWNVEGHRLDVQTKVREG